jgi:ABC-type long-subunit fatty acid transport system fused permease/ATPase subunit
LDDDEDGICILLDPVFWLSLLLYVLVLLTCVVPDVEDVGEILELLLLAELLTWSMMGLTNCIAAVGVINISGLGAGGTVSNKSIESALEGLACLIDTPC